MKNIKKIIKILDNKGEQTHLGQFETQEELESWIEQGVKNKWWGDEGDYKIGEPIDLEPEIQEEKKRKKDKKKRLKELSELSDFKKQDIEEALKFLLKKYHDEL